MDADDRKRLLARIDNKVVDRIDDMCDDIDTLMNDAGIPQDERSEMVREACDSDIQEYYDNWVEEGQ